ncbi:MAG: hypothetical protein AB1Z66_07645 [Candidatus Limnocylindrales bacterium]
MRLPAAAASILAIGLIAAACGGDEATPEPTDEPTPAATEAAAEATEAPAEEATAEPAEEATEAPAEEATEAPAEESAEEATEAPAEEAAEGSAAEEAVAEPEFGKKAAITNEDDPATTFGLTSGRYRMQWSTTDCEQIEVVVTQQDGDFVFPWPSRSSFASATINDLPEGMYTIEQVDPTCEEWSVRVDWMTN